MAAAPKEKNKKNQQIADSSGELTTEMVTFRLPKELTRHLEYAHDMSELTKTVIVKRAIKGYLEEHYPLPGLKSTAVA